MTEAETKPRVDLQNLRIAEAPARSGGSRVFVLILLLVFLGGGFAAGWLLRGRGSRLGAGPVPVRVEIVRPDGGGGAASTGGFTEGGWVEVPSYHPIVVSALAAGRIEKLHVLEGSRVEKGQVVAELWDRDLEDAVRLAEAEVAEAKARLDLVTAGYREEDRAKASAEVERLEAEVDLAEKIRARTASLVDDGAASHEDLERDASTLATARAKLKSATEERRRLDAGFRVEEIAGAKADLARAEAARDLARTRLSYATVTSPADGVVLERFVTAGSFVSASNPRIVSLYDPDDLQVRVDVRQESANQVFIGQRVEITTDSEPDRAYAGEVIRLEPLADFKKNTIQAKVRIAEPGPRLHPEMICRARFFPKEQTVVESPGKRAVTVSEAAVVDEDGRTFVFALRGNAIQRREVRLGERRDGRVVVEAGVTVGDRVVLGPPAGLADGDEAEEIGR